MADLTPMMQQYQSIKKRYPDSILFFRMGDFYEMFADDAKIAARVLDLALTSRNKGGGKKTPMAGVPAHSAESYIATLIEEDYKVAICEQLEDPDEANGLVERDVIRVITPGTVIETELLKEKENNYLTSVVSHNEKIGLAYVDISTGEFKLTEFKNKNGEKTWDELDRIQPREVMIEEQLKDSNYQQFLTDSKLVENTLTGIDFDLAYKILIEHFSTTSLTGFGCENKKAGIIAAGEIINFLQETQKRTLSHINKLQTYELSQYMVLDSATRRNLELTKSIRTNKTEGTLLDILDKTITSMGGRLIKKWIHQPLIDIENINRRLDAIEELIDNYMLLQKLREKLKGIYDLERILSKISYESANARDLASLKFSLEKLPALKNDLEKLQVPLFKDLNHRFDPLDDLYQLLNESIVDDPPVSVREGGLIKESYNSELDELRRSCKAGKDWITNLQKEERERTGIGSLKVGFNKIFGYYIEVTNPNLDRVPDDYTRKQTLSNSERYITPELKEKEALVLGAEERINDLEYKLFVEVRNKIGENIDRIKKTAGDISLIDVLLSLALVAIEQDYKRPRLDNDRLIEIKAGRHPVVEDMQDKPFVPNDTLLDGEDNRFIIITGPNMSGKSTYMRQVALIVLMSQLGSFVPVESAHIGISDRIFTRVGASDDLTTGQSTFMVEMNEVANIVNNATDKSLIILDEVGRGTSTYDGVSIAWAVSEYINNPDKIGARTLFATHYHELTHLEDEFTGVRNYNVLVEEDEEGVHFLHKIVPGQADDSYGIEVARLAGLPSDLLENARNILDNLENSNDQKLLTSINESKLEKNKREERKIKQIPLFSPENPIVKQIKNAEIVNMTPMEALNFLYQLQQETRKKEEKHG